MVTEATLDPSPERSPGPPGVAVGLMAVVVLSVVGTLAGAALAPTLVDTHPLWLLALDARTRHLALAAAADVSLVGWATVALLRLVVADPAFYLLGRWYGDRAREWLVRAAPIASSRMETAERVFRRFGWPLVAVAPNGAVCFAAGTTGLAPAAFGALNVAGTVGRLVLVWWLGDVFEGPLDAVLGFIRDFRAPLTVASVGLVLIQVRRHPKR